MHDYKKNIPKKLLKIKKLNLIGEKYIEKKRRERGRKKKNDKDCRSNLAAMYVVNSIFNKFLEYIMV